MSQFQLRRLLLEAIRFDKTNVSAAFQPSSIFFGCNLAVLHGNHWFSFNQDFKSNVNRYAPIPKSEHNDNAPRFRPGKRTRRPLSCRFVSSRMKCCVTSCAGDGKCCGAWNTDKAHFQKLVHGIRELMSMACRQLRPNFETQKANFNRP